MRSNEAAGEISGEIVERLLLLRILWERRWGGGGGGEARRTQRYGMVVVVVVIRAEQRAQLEASSEGERSKTHMDLD